MTGSVHESVMSVGQSGPDIVWVSVLLLCRRHFFVWLPTEVKNMGLSSDSGAAVGLGGWQVLMCLIR